MAELVREVLIDATPDTIFPFLIEPEKHLEWLGSEVALDPRPGGEYRVLVGSAHPALGEFLEVVPNEKVAFTFGWDEPGHPIPAGSTRIDITLEPDGDKTRLRFVHSGLPADAISDHTKGWDHYLDRLSRAVSGESLGPDVSEDDAQQAG